MTRPYKQLAARLAIAAGTLGLAGSARAKPPYCTFVPDKVYVLETGSLAVLANNGEEFHTRALGYVIICNVEDAYCQVWHETIVSAMLSGKRVTVKMKHTKSCSQLATDSKEATTYVRLIR